MTFAFAGHHLIAFIRAWHIAVNEAAVQNGFRFAFRFNTYIISVLVIFFLQLNHNFPKLEDLPQSQSKFINHVPQVDGKKFKHVVQQFFGFYGKVYEKCKLISVDIGRWQNRKLDKNQTILTPQRQKFVNLKPIYFSLFIFSTFN